MGLSKSALGLPIRILLVDSDQQLLSGYREHLETYGFAVDTAQTGLQCLQALQSRMPHVIVLEPQLDWGDGAGVLEVMQEELRACGTKVVVFSSGEQFEWLREVAAPVVLDYVPKPLPPHRLAATLLWNLGQGIRPTPQMLAANLQSRQRALAS